MTIYGYKAVDFSNASGTPTFSAHKRAAGDFHTVKIMTLQEDTEANPVETTLQLPTEGVAAFIMGSRLEVVSRVNLYTFTLKGKLSATAAFEQPVDEAVKLTDTKLLLSSNGMFLHWQRRLIDRGLKRQKNEFYRHCNFTGTGNHDPWRAVPRVRQYRIQCWRNGRFP